MSIARVIVDVPTSGVNQTFDYLIPKKLNAVVQRGVRVIIPFGNRKITGFVIEIVSTSDYKELKEVIDVLDITPVLTDELLEVGRWLAEETLSLYITTYQAMLPQVLKAKYEKEIVKMTDNPLHDELAPFFEKTDRVNYDFITGQLTSFSLLKNEIEKGNVKINYVVKSRERKQFEKIVVPAKKELLEAALLQIRPQAKRQREIITFFLEHEDEIEQTILYNELNITKSNLNPLIDKGLLSIKEREVYRDPFQREVKQTDKLPLNEEQDRALKQIIESIQLNEHRTFLLHGVTGSGKTEVYLQAIETVVNEGKEAIVLVPEISLTPQMVLRFKERFGNLVAVLHSGLSVGEKYDEWRKVLRKEVKVVVGARSAIFAPFENVGIIIIDEEHETTYKQEESPRYHAKHVAIKRGELNRCPVLLGSATPTLEAYARAQKNVYTLLTLKKRANKKPLPPVEIVDMRKELHSGNRSMFSRRLIEQIHNRLEKKEQIVLLLNRRGYSNFTLCRDCGYVDQCPYCDISLTYHKRDHKLKCHYCLYEKEMPHRCPDCDSDAIHFFGTGTERVQEALYKAIPNIRVIRMDVDTTRRKGAHERLLQQFANQEADILLGTQMIAKGLDFKNVTLVGVLAADSMLHLPDFRSSERTFQLITQVSGRAGRHDLSGEVIVQTYTPEHYSIQLASIYDYIQFYKQEMQLRRTFQYPPYYFLTLINITHENKAKVHEVSYRLTNHLRNYLTKQAIILGPTPSPIARLKNRYRYQILIKYRNEPELHNGLYTLLDTIDGERRRGLQLTIDMDPYHFM